MRSNNMNKELELQPVNAGIVMPAVSVAEAKKSWQAYEDLKAAIVVPSDIQIIKGKQFLKKSYWRKIATFFNLNVDIVEERESVSLDQDNKPVDRIYHFTCKATANNGRYAIGVGSCGVVEKDGSQHNARSTAETRAFNRAVSNLVGGGEVSADEIRKEDIDEEDEDLAVLDKIN